ncbi:hypothetical protein LSAT2_012358 [Lamellibrachia satsuma]|nr:hypothetical protein LSAT2_012358 [Lamellibrachia satsuma]
MEELCRLVFVAELPGCLELLLIPPVEEKTEQQKLDIKDGVIPICTTNGAPRFFHVFVAGATAGSAHYNIFAICAGG